MEIKGKVAAWGRRLVVPAFIIRELGLEVGDVVTWMVEERDGEKVAILKKEVKGNDGRYRG